MRAYLTRAILRRTEAHMPEPVRRIGLQILLNLTARAFGRKRIRIWTLDSERALQTYALFTRSCMQSGPCDPERLYRLSFSLGARLRRLSGLRAEEDLARLVFALYRIIGIEMRGQLPGDITVTACFFSRFYSPAQCRQISALDDGWISGVYGGGRLEFTSRITEGCATCTAHFTGGDFHAQ